MLKGSSWLLNGSRGRIEGHHSDMGQPREANCTLQSLKCVSLSRRTFMNLLQRKALRDTQGQCRHETQSFFFCIVTLNEN
jgi:hypothetical protein